MSNKLEANHRWAIIYFDDGSRRIIPRDFINIKGIPVHFNELVKGATFASKKEKKIISNSLFFHTHIEASKHFKAV